MEAALLSHSLLPTKPSHKETNMAYTITSDRLDVSKSLGEKLSDKELLELGVNIDALVEAGHLSPDALPTPAPANNEGEVNG